MDHERCMGYCCKHFVTAESMGGKGTLPISPPVAPTLSGVAMNAAAPFPFPPLTHP